MALIEKKIYPKYFEKILSGDKTWDLRLSDWEARPGDTLLLKEWDPNKAEYTGREVEKTVGYVGRIRPQMLPYWSHEDVEKYGLQIISLK